MIFSRGGKSMKKILIVFVAVSFWSVAAYADGKAIFKAKGCAACHHPTKDQRKMGLGPSIKQIKAAYKGNKAALKKFLRGKAQPRIDKKKFKMLMKSQLAMIKNLPEAKLNALVNYLLK